MKRLAVALSCVALFFVQTFTLSSSANHTMAAPGVLGVNLIVNGDAEASPGATNDTSALAPAGWQASPGFTVAQYGASEDFPILTDPGPGQRGKNLFAGGPTSPMSTGTQQINLPATLQASKQYRYAYRVSGYFGGYENRGDYATLAISFISATGGTLSSKSIGGVTPQERNDQTGLLQRFATGYAPTGTRSINVVLTMVRLGGGYNYGYADDLSLVLRRVPVKKHYRSVGAGGG